MLEILHYDAHYIAINKPPGLLVHRSSIAKDVTEFALQQLRDQLNEQVSPVHRLDRKTSGVLLFSFHSQAHVVIQKLFADKNVSKTYWAVVRGFTADDGIIDYPLKRDDGKVQEAVTHFRTLTRAELKVPFGKHPTSRYSLVEITPETGRMHQIRKHFAHVFHPIIGDRPHGCNKQNRLFKEKWNMTEMLLHARKLQFTHPFTHEEVSIVAPLHSEFKRMIRLMGLPSPIETPIPDAHEES